MNKPKRIGTEAETAVVRYAEQHGFPLAERRALAGAVDKGDVLLAPGVIVEVKAGKQAEDASDELVLTWWRETCQERWNAKADVAVLVTKRRGKGAASAGQWWAHVDLQHLLLVGADAPWPHQLGGIMLRLTLADALRLIRMHGYGTPLPPTESVRSQYRKAS